MTNFLFFYFFKGQNDIVLPLFACKWRHFALNKSSFLSLANIAFHFHSPLSLPWFSAFIIVIVAVIDLTHACLWLSTTTRHYPPHINDKSIKPPT